MQQIEPIKYYRSKENQIKAILDGMTHGEVLELLEKLRAEYAMRSNIDNNAGVNHFKRSVFPSFNKDKK